VGGWSFALHKACQDIQDNKASMAMAFKPKCLGAFDHSDLCNKVYKHNFPTVQSGNNARHSKKMKQNKKKQKIQKDGSQKAVSIEKLSKEQLQEMNASIWMMSPPCQPHTRQHSNQNEDANDPRSKSFLHLCDLISTMNADTLPKMILLENVIGFENVSHYLDEETLDGFINTHLFIVIFRAIAVNTGENLSSVENILSTTFI
jgi:tRNA (cytosine38-C5)-methyltransferase